MTECWYCFFFKLKHLKQPYIFQIQISMKVENTFINSTGSDGVMFVVGTSVVRWKEVLVIIFLLLLWLYSVNRFLSIWRDINYSAEHIPRNYSSPKSILLSKKTRENQRKCKKTRENQRKPEKM